MIAPGPERPSTNCKRPRFALISSNANPPLEANASVRSCEADGFTREGRQIEATRDRHPNRTVCSSYLNYDYLRDIYEETESR